ncbi:MAG: tyrosine-protein phosphatase [Actinocrinis sp.]
MNDQAASIAGLPNFRDIGGLPAENRSRTRFRTLYRSPAPEGTSAESAAGLSALGLRAVLDLRDETELDTWPYELADPSVRRINVPVLANQAVPQDQAGLYRHMIEACGPGFTEAVRAIASEAAQPILVHCAAGKDRTGVTIALALTAAGVSREAVVADFLLSNPGLNIPDPESAPDGAGNDRYQVHRRVHAALIEDALDRAARLGGDIPGYLATHGMTDDELASLRTTLIESARSE